MGMQATLRARTDRVVGILNGVDYREWDPRHDPHLTAHFGRRILRGKHVNKQRCSRPPASTSAPQPLIGMVTRLAEQKGIDLLFDALPRAAARSGISVSWYWAAAMSVMSSFFESLAQALSGRVAFRGGHDEPLAHLIEAGSDMFLMPSRYEPCGLNQMYSLRYGTIPIVRSTGGLADSVQHYDPASGVGTGCVFNDYDAPAVAGRSKPRSIGTPIERAGSG